MSLRVRLMLLSTAWFLFVIVLFSSILYQVVLNVTTKSDRELLFAKAHTILQDERVLIPNNWDDPNLLNDYLVSDEMIRIADMNGFIQVQIYSNDVLPRKPVVVTDRKEFAVKREGKERYVYVAVPIDTIAGQIGVLEIGRILRRWNEVMDLLLTAVILLSAGAAVLSLIGSFFYSRFIFRPLGHLYDTMEAIRQSGTFRRLDKAFTSTDDELGKLGKMFNDMIGQIESQVNRQKRFMSDVSHELRTPLTIIESYASLLKRWGFDDPELRKESIESIHSEAVRLKGMVSDMLKLAQAEEAHLQAVKTDLASIVRTAAAAMERTFRRKITVEPFSGKAIVLGDPEKLKQLFIIILDNAVKYSQKPVTVRILRTNGRVAVQTIDKGTGVGEKELPFIFDRFYRTDQSRSRSTGGHGLGLAIAKKIVEQHEGAIRMDSKPGFGTVVTVSLPLADD